MSGTGNDAATATAGKLAAHLSGWPLAVPGEYGRTAASGLWVEESSVHEGAVLRWRWAHQSVRLHMPDPRTAERTLLTLLRERLAQAGLASADGPWDRVVATAPVELVPETGDAASPVPGCSVARFAQQLGWPLQVLDANDSTVRAGLRVVPLDGDGAFVRWAWPNDVYDVSDSGARMAAAAAVGLFTDQLESAGWQVTVDPDSLMVKVRPRVWDASETRSVTVRQLHASMYAVTEERETGARHHGVVFNDVVRERLARMTDFEKLTQDMDSAALRLDAEESGVWVLWPTAVEGFSPEPSW